MKPDNSNRNANKIVEPQDAKKLLTTTIQPGNRVVLEGNNQKQAAFLAETLASLPSSRVHDLHILMSSVTLDATWISLEKKLPPNSISLFPASRRWPWPSWSNRVVSALDQSTPTRNCTVATSPI